MAPRLLHQGVAITASIFALGAAFWAISDSGERLREPAPVVRLDDDRFHLQHFSAYGDAEEKVLFDEFVAQFGNAQRREYLKQFSLHDIADEFPVRAGMTVDKLDRTLADNEVQLQATDFEKAKTLYSFGWEKRILERGDGSIYFWVNGKHLLHCDIVVRSGVVQSVWVMPGNREWVSGVFFRLSGTGPYLGRAEIY